VKRHAGFWSRHQLCRWHFPGQTQCKGSIPTRVFPSIICTIQLSEENQGFITSDSLTMPRAKKTWKDKMATKPPHHVVLEKDFAGVKSGSKLHISSPQEIADELRKIRPGETVSLQQFRQKIAQAQACDATCPVSTSIFLRIVAEYAWEEHNERNVPLADLPPFWRVVEPGTPLSKKLSFDQAWIALQRELEKDLPGA
jgi:hypothetical protein